MNAQNPLGAIFPNLAPKAPVAGKVSMQDFHFTMRIGSPLDPGLSLF